MLDNSFCFTADNSFCFNEIIKREDNLDPIDIHSDSEIFPNEDIFERTYNPLNYYDFKSLDLNDYNQSKSCIIPDELDEDRNSAKNNEIFFHDNGIIKNTEKTIN